MITLNTMYNTAESLNDYSNIKCLIPLNLSIITLSKMFNTANSLNNYPKLNILYV